MCSQCIYTKMTESDSSFSSKEHIFPKSIGGVYCLPKGWVSDDVNNDLSGLELELIRKYPTIVMARYLYLTKSRKNHVNYDSIRVFQDETGCLSKQIINLKSNPITMPQLIFRRNYDISQDYNIQALNIENDDAFYNFYNLIKKTPAINCIELKRTEIDELECYVTIINNTLYFVFSESLPSNKVIDEINQIKKYVESRCIELRSEQKLILGRGSVNIQTSFQMEKVRRAAAKIYFNGIARLFGHEFILNDDFDGMRNAILGGNIDSYISRWESDFTNIENTLSYIFNKGQNINKSSHVIFSMVDRDRVLKGFLVLYGLFHVSFHIGPITSDVDCLPRGYICDHELKKEYIFDASDQDTLIREVKF